MANCGLSSAACSRNGNPWSVFWCTERGRQSVVCLRLVAAGMATCGLSSTAQVAELEKVAGTTFCDHSSSAWSGDGNSGSVSSCLVWITVSGLSSIT